MFKKALNSFLVIVGLVYLLGSQPVFAQQGDGLDPRVKALSIMAIYGTTGGFLLGTAALAFDAPGRSPFIGASLGLYAGILFGTYVVVTHAVKKHKMENPGDPDDENYYPETPDSPYESPFQQDGGGSSLEIPIQGLEKGQIISWADRQPAINQNAPAFYFNLVNINF